MLSRDRIPDPTVPWWGGAREERYEPFILRSRFRLPTRSRMVSLLVLLPLYLDENVSQCCRNVYFPLWLFSLDSTRLNPIAENLRGKRSNGFVVIAFHRL